MTKIEAFFVRYEEWANSFDLDLGSSLYTADFMAGDPNGVSCGHNDQALRDAFIQRKESFQQIGFKRAKILHLEATPLDEKYTMAKVHWQMTFEKQSSHSLDFNFFITYFLYDPGTGPKAAFWISHDDEQRVLREAGLIPIQDSPPRTDEAATEPVMNSTPQLAIEPMTIPRPDGSGYLADPQPVHLAPSSGGQVVLLSGTTKAVIRGTYPLTPGSFSWTPVKINTGTLAAEIDAAYATFTNFQNLALFQDNAGDWHAVVTIGVKNDGYPGHWTVVAHAHPTVPAQPESAPLEWSADTVLTGSFAHPEEGNYDAKYFVDGDQLYLLYVKSIAPPPALRNVIMIQPMRSPTQPAPVEPIMLLEPGEFESERFATTLAKLVEAPYISRIGNTYALVYSTGSYLTSGYKAAVAWSDTLLPPSGGLYRKVLQLDKQGVWGQLGQVEVHYLMQSEKEQWPNFTGAQVIGAGDAAAVQEPGGGWWLFFNGYAPGDMIVNCQVAPSHRRPYFLGLEVQIPEGQTVATASDEELAGWLTPVTR